MQPILKLYFSPFYDLDYYIEYTKDINQSAFNEAYVGLNGLLDRLELFLGLKAKFSNENRRARLYREAMAKVGDKKAFYYQSFEADPAATACELLSWRDELTQGGLDFKRDGLPKRIADLAKIEHEFRTNGFSHYSGNSDRWQRVLKHLQANESLPKLEIVICFPQELLTGFEKSIITALSKNSSITIAEQGHSYDQDDVQSDLSAFKERVKQVIASEPSVDKFPKLKLRGDKSIRILKGADPVELGYLVKHYIKEDKSDYSALVSGGNLNLLSLLLESDGLPAPAIDSEPPEDPFLQIIRLVPSCIWKPLDTYVLLEFLLFPELPFDNFLGKMIAEVVSKKPGRMSEDWDKKKEAWYKYKTEKKKEEEKKVRTDLAEFNHWTEHVLYDEANETDQDAVKERIKDLYGKLGDWAHRKFQAIKKGENREETRYAMLHEICCEIIESVNNLPARQILHKLKLEQLISEAMLQNRYKIKKADRGSIQPVQCGFSLIDNPHRLVYWNAVSEKSSVRMKWLPQETDWFTSHGIHHLDPLREQKRTFRAGAECVLRTRDELILVIPESDKGEVVENGAVYALISGLCENITEIEFHFPEDAEKLKVKLETKKHLQLPEVKEYWNIKPSERISIRETESYSSLESLLYYPYAWVLNYHAGIAPAVTVSMTSDPALMGTLAHRFIELIVKDDPNLRLSEQAIKDRLNALFDEILEKEGALLLLPERIKDKNYFLWQLEKAIPYFIQQCRANNWKEIEVEKTLKGMLGEILVRSRADILLKKDKDKAVVDIKQFQSKKLLGQLETDNDLQLVLYSGLWGQPNMARSAYFFVNKCKFAAKNDLAFREAEIVGEQANNAEDMNRETWIKMINTAKFRLQEIVAGRIEVAEDMEVSELDLTLQRESMNLLTLPLQDKSGKKKPREYNDYKNLIKVN